MHAYTHVQVTEKKLSKLDVAYQSYLEQQAQLEDPVRRLEVSINWSLANSKHCA